MTYEYQSNGRLRVEAVATETNSQIKFEIVRNSGLPDEWVEPWKKAVARHARLPHVEDGSDFADRQLMAREHAHKAQARLVGESLEPREWGGVVVNEHIKIS